MSSRAADVARGVLAAGTLAALVVGPPLALVLTIGWPLPTSIPTLDDLQTALRTGVDGTFVVKSLAVLAWIAWLQIALALASEVVAVRRRRPALHLPVVPGLQPFVARLVAAALLIVATTGSRTTPAAATPTPLRAAPVAVQVQRTTPVAPVTSSATSNLPAATAPATVTVERHDSYWAIAERSLGDGFRWREIRDLNVGRTMTDGTIVASNSDIVRPGWVLLVPTEAPGPAAEPMATSLPLIPTGVEVTVASGDGFWNIASEQVQAQLGRAPTDDEIRPYWSALIAANQERLADPSNPDLLFIGQNLELVGTAPASSPEPIPAAEAAPPTEPTPPPSPTTTPPAAPGVDAPSTTATPATTPVVANEAPSLPIAVDPIPADEPVDGEDVPTGAVAAGVSALLAVGALRLLSRQRRRRAHLRVVPDGPTPALEAETHRQLVVDGDEDLVDGLNARLSELASSLAADGGPATPLLVQHDSGHLDVYVEPPAAPPAGWRTSPDAPGVWICDERAPISAKTDAPSPAPLLVTVGLADDGGQLYLDLESAGLVSLTGDPDTTRGVARTIVAELALTPLGEGLDIIVIGDLASADVSELPHVRRARDWEEIVDELEAWIGQTHAALLTNGWASPFSGRAAAPDHDALAPLAVVADSVPPERLQRYFHEHRPTVAAVVAIGEVADAFEIACSPDSLHLRALDIDVRPQPLSEPALESIVALLDEPDLDLGHEVDAPTLFEDLTVVDGEPDRIEPEIFVRLLGDIHVDGADELTSKQTAVLAFVALHGSVAAERIEDAVWATPSSGSRRKRLANTISEVRAAIGRHHLPAAADGRYVTGPGVGTDTQAFDHLVRRAAREDPGDAARTLRDALDLVTGPVFTYRAAERASYAWIDLENLVSTWELRITAVAERCTDLHIELGLIDDAVTIATQALHAVPTHTGLTEALMRAHAANGDRLAVQRVFQAHAAALEQLDLDDVAATTAQLYERLAQRSG